MWCFDTKDIGRRGGLEVYAAGFKSRSCAHVQRWARWARGRQGAESTLFQRTRRMATTPPTTMRCSLPLAMGASSAIASSQKLLEQTPRVQPAATETATSARVLTALGPWAASYARQPLNKLSRMKPSLGCVVQPRFLI